MNKSMIFKLILFALIAVIAIISIFFNIKPLVIVDIGLILALLVWLNRKK